jgi:hypothetical protein
MKDQDWTIEVDARLAGVDAELQRFVDLGAPAANGMVTLRFPDERRGRRVMIRYWIAALD